jgi:hypothetical protein
MSSRVCEISRKSKNLILDSSEMVEVIVGVTPGADGIDKSAVVRDPAEPTAVPTSATRPEPTAVPTAAQTFPTRPVPTAARDTADSSASTCAITCDNAHSGALDNSATTRARTVIDSM